MTIIELTDLIELTLIVLGFIGVILRIDESRRDSKEELLRMNEKLTEKIKDLEKEIDLIRRSLLL